MQAMQEALRRGTAPQFHEQRFRHCKMFLTLHFYIAIIYEI